MIHLRDGESIANLQNADDAVERRCVDRVHRSCTRTGIRAASGGRGSRRDLAEDFASALTTLHSKSGECVTTVTTLPNRYGLSAAMADETIEILRDGAAELDCIPVLRVVREDGEPIDMSHLAKYLPVEARDGDLVLK